MSNTTTKPIYVGGDLHAKLKSLAATKRKTLGEFCEVHLRRLLKTSRKNRVTAAANGKAAK